MMTLHDLLDLPLRASRLLRGLLHLRRPAPLAFLRAERDPDRFLLRAFLASGRHLAIASALLPTRRYREGAVAFLGCRVLDAFEDLCPDPEEAASKLLAALDYLCGGRAEPPGIEGPRAARETDAVELVLVERLPTLRALLSALPQERALRVRALLSEMAGVMAAGLRAGRRKGRADPRSYGDGVLGSAAAYALELLMGTAPPALGSRAAGRLLQLANDLRDLDADRALGRGAPGRSREGARQRILLQVAAEAPQAAALLSALDFERRSASRGAMAFMVATTAAFLARSVGIDRSPGLRRPLLAALCAALAPAGWRALLEEVDQALARCVLAPEPGELSSGPAAAPGRARSRFETRLALQHPNPEVGESAAAALRMVELATELVSGIADAPLHEGPDPHRSAERVLMGDLLLGVGVELLSRVGPETVCAYGDLIAEIAKEEAASGRDCDHAVPCAGFLTRVSAPALPAEARARLVSRRAGLLRELDSLDRSQGAKGALPTPSPEPGPHPALAARIRHDQLSLQQALYA